MAKIKQGGSKSGDQSIKKSKFDKNSSFSGVESKKSPKNRRKSLATVLPTPKKPMASGILKAKHKLNLPISKTKDDDVSTPSKKTQKNLFPQKTPKSLNTPQLAQETVGKSEKKNRKSLLIQAQLAEKKDDSFVSTPDIFSKSAKKKRRSTLLPSQLADDCLNSSLSVPKSEKKKERKSLLITSQLADQNDVSLNSSQNVPKSEKKKNRKSLLLPSQLAQIQNESLNLSRNISNSEKKKHKKLLMLTEPSIQENIEGHSNSQSIKKKKLLKQSKTGKQNSNTKYEKFEKTYSISPSNVETAVNCVKKFITENPKLKSQLFEDKLPLHLQISCFKVPRGPTKILRIPLPNPLITNESDVCLIVPEVKGINNIDHEKHIDYYTELLEKNNVTCIKKIMTMHELRTEYETFELRRRLVDLYDMFLVDGRVSGKAVHRLGKIFYNKRKVPTPVRLNVGDVKKNIEHAVTKVQMHLNLKGDFIAVNFGHHEMSTKALVENVFGIMDFLIDKFPGGIGNVRSLNIAGFRATPVPIYMDLKNPSEVPVPKMPQVKPKAYKSVKGELTTLPNATVTVLPSGEVIVDENEDELEESDLITTEDILNDIKKDTNKSNDNEDKKKTKKRKQTNSEGTVSAPPKKVKKGKSETEDKVNKVKKESNNQQNIDKVSKVTENINIKQVTGENSKVKKDKQLKMKKIEEKLEMKNKKQEIQGKYQKDLGTGDKDSKKMKKAKNHANVGSILHQEDVTATKNVKNKMNKNKLGLKNGSAKNLKMMKKV